MRKKDKMNEREKLNSGQLYGFKNTFGHIRMDSRWSLNDCIKRLRKSERIVKFEIKEIPMLKVKADSK